jgi:annexin A7/11
LTLITCIRDRPTFFAERIHKAISGLGTKDSNLIRVIVSRSEIDLAQIKQRYQQVYNRSLAHDVGGDTSGDYKRVLLSIIK